MTGTGSHLLGEEWVRRLVIRLHFTCPLKMKLLGKPCAEARGHAVRRLADRYGSRTVFHVPLLVQAKKRVPMVSRDLSRTLPLTVPARGSALHVSVLSLIKMTGAHLMP